MHGVESAIWVFEKYKVEEILWEMLLDLYSNYAFAFTQVTLVFYFILFAKHLITTTFYLNNSWHFCILQILIFPLLILQGVHLKLRKANALLRRFIFIYMRQSISNMFPSNMFPWKVIKSNSSLFLYWWSVTNRLILNTNYLFLSALLLFNYVPYVDHQQW